MANAFTNFLSGVGKGVFGSDKSFFHDYQHANRLYVTNTYARAPKVQFLYFVSFNINPNAVIDQGWKNSGMKDVGLLVKKLDMPKFTMPTDILNQYNRRVPVYKNIKYNDITMTFHDDNSDITNWLWKNYYQYHYADGWYDVKSRSAPPEAFRDTKFNSNSFFYGGNSVQINRFFDSIDIYVMHQQKFTQMTLLNPLITAWDHDSLSQDDQTRALANKATISYEGVLYKNGKLKKDKDAKFFSAVYYDNTPSPIRPGGIAGVLGGVSDIFGENGSLKNAKTPLDFLGVAINAGQTWQDAKKINAKTIRSDTERTISRSLTDLQNNGNRPEVRNNIGVSITSAFGNNNTNAQQKKIN